MDERKADGKGELGDPQVGLDLPPAVLPAHLPPVKMNAPAGVGQPEAPSRAHGREQGHRDNFKLTLQKDGGTGRRHKNMLNIRFFP